ncbi:S66 family peptidase [Mycoplasmopsis pulmonis]|uniref:S66 family peptidase n=1 Tax=Mycoplasmopsis pulmonis TaxID=2107 RepID=UPI001004F4BA|nr:S66 peptidase family protein [Mycoplasmopsis pulmonis]VEU67859.1 L,D-carboxypeptidase A [Mycoplasmopsis pulmonis]
MIKPKKLNAGDKIAIVSLSSGVLGEAFCKHQLDLGIERLKKFGLEAVFMENSLKGLEFIKNNPQARANDLKSAFYNPEIKAILCAIGGLDTHRIFEYLFNDEEFMSYVKNNPKIFIGYSDSTNNHLFFNKLNVVSYYGMNFLSDFAELDKNMLSYTEQNFKMFFENKPSRQILLSPEWYEERKDFSQSQLGTARVKHDEKRGFQVIRGKGKIKGELFGGSLEVFYNGLNKDQQGKSTFKTFDLIPSKDVLKKTILFLETSEYKPEPKLFEKMIDLLIENEILQNVKALIFGKPQDEVFFDEYKKILKDKSEKFDLPIFYNINFGHALPHNIIPYGIELEIDFDHKTLTLTEPLFDEKIKRI